MNPNNGVGEQRENVSSSSSDAGQGGKNSEGPKKPNQFMQNVANANENMICRATAQDVRTVSMLALLKNGLRIPIFQRRYCWGQDQWSTLLQDARSVATGFKDRHSLGRITCVKNEDDEGRLLVIDGQQRNTTVTLMLAAIRDLTTLQLENGDSEIESKKKLISMLNNVLICHPDRLREWVESNERTKSGGMTVVEEGATLNQSTTVIPTYCDRASYFQAILPPHLKVQAPSGLWARPMEGKRYFMRVLARNSLTQLAALAHALLHKLEWLLFPIQMTGNNEDGTEDLQVVFERLAIRDATHCKPSRSTEYASMGAADFVRNLLLGSFQREVDAVRAYKEYWLPIEKAAAGIVSRFGERAPSNAGLLEDVLAKFLDAQPSPPATTSMEQMWIGGFLYPKFRRWLLWFLSRDGIGHHSDQGTIKVLNLMRAFSLDYLNNFDPCKNSLVNDDLAMPPMAMPPMMNAKKRYTNEKKWNCQKCNFPNENRCSMCTACGHISTHLT